MEISRREVLAKISAAAMVGQVSLEAAQHVHEEAKAAATSTGGVYKPKALTQHEFDTLKTLCEIIVPGASKGGAAEFIDLLSSQNPDMSAIYTGGIGWLDEVIKHRYQADFMAAKAEQRTELLDLIAYRKNRTPELAPGIRFFDWARRMTVDAYYTSPAGIKEVGYLGNRAIREFKIPQEAIDYAVKRSPFA
ncbi:MAG TPA: gluconate 2-dehydrogenase subunit 3 family protein [Bryobacteraceae bacterium]|nr:gluconate 2-dehydrogenase subunit 3 family protein [Bryobacteraceae bacterium]